jgi:predicted Ser/Thr protein kinase
VSSIKKEHGYDLKILQCIGFGMHGKVYKIDNTKCIKIFKKTEVCRKEIETLAMAQGNSFFPKLYDFGERFIVREFVRGVELDRYLKDHPLTVDISENIINVYKALIEVGYTRHDTALLHIFIDEDMSLRVIDTAKAMTYTTKYPKLILSDLNSLGYKDLFLEHVKELDYELYIFLINKNKH